METRLAGVLALVIRSLAAANALHAFAGSVRGQSAPQPVDLELVLAVDVSYSMDPAEQALQRQGYVEAFRHPDVIAAIRGGRLGRIAATYVEWGGRAVQIVPWTAIDGSAAGESFAGALEEQPLQRISFTSISNALLFSRRLFRANPFFGLRQVIDISGDGPNNGGAPAPLARDTALREGIVIDGLPIMLEGRADAATIPDLDAYYENCVIGGPGAFILRVTSAEKFAEAIRRKLILEITGPRLARAPGDTVPIPAAYVPSTRYDCLIGERQQEMQAP